MTNAGSITDIPGLKVGHWSDKRALTGCTVIIPDRPAVAGVGPRRPGAAAVRGAGRARKPAQRVARRAISAGERIAEVRIEDALHEIVAPASGRATIVAEVNAVIEPGSVLATLDDTTPRT